MRTYSADFETTTKEEDCRVWAWGVCDIEKIDEFVCGIDIDSFISFISDHEGAYYFHNLKFDGNYIIYYLLTHGYTHVKKRKDFEPGEFSTAISDMGQWYKVEIQMLETSTGYSAHITIFDSAKIIPMPLEEIPDTYGLEEEKLDIDYHEDRPKGHQLTQQEYDYLKNDVIIVAKAVKFMHDNGQTKLTSASNALSDYKSRFDKKTYKRLFPELDKIVDADIRKSYKGGWTYLNPAYKNKQVGEGCVYDVNSMYPWAMMECLLPYGDPYYFSGEPTQDDNYPLYVINFLAEFDLKPGMYPSIQVKNSIYADNEYLTHSIQPTVLTLTSIDYELFLHNYNVQIIEFYGGYRFKARRGMFKEYIEYWYEQKATAKRTGNKGLEKISKLMLNALYGKFGSRMERKAKIPWYDPDKDLVRYKIDEPESCPGGYLPVATFITSYCRDKIIRTAEVCGDRFCYADTDSVHIVGTEPVPGMDCDEYRLGAFKVEEKFIRAKFIRQKTYLEIYEKEGEEKMNLKCCGMPEKMKKSVTEDMFVEGAIFDASLNPTLAPKLMPKVVPGGVILKETTFQIKTSKPIHVTKDDTEP